MPEHPDIDNSELVEPKPVVMKGVPVAGQAEKLIRVRREITQTENLTRLEQIELEANEKAREILDDAQTRAETILAEANKEANSIRNKARSDGDLTAKKEALGKLQGLISTLEKEINDIRQVRNDFLNNNLEGIIDLACGLAGKIIVSELNTRPEMIAERALELMNRMPPESNVVLTASQEDIDVIQTYISHINGPDDMFKSSIRSDPKLKSGCLRLESDSGRIDSRLLEVLDELGGILKEQASHIAGNSDSGSTEASDGN